MPADRMIIAGLRDYLPRSAWAARQVRLPAYSVAQRGHDRPVGHVEPRPIHLTADDSQLVAKKQQLRLRVATPQAHIDEVEQYAQN